jgi:hypothetical protein
MKLKLNFLLLFIIGNIAAVWVHWYTFMFIKPAVFFVTLALHVILLINIPYKKFQTKS